MAQTRLLCERCGKRKKEVEFFKRRDGTRCSLCKQCMTAGIDNRNPNSFLWILKELDVPYVEDVWVAKTNEAYIKDPGSFGSMSVIGPYVRMMNMMQYNQYRYADSRSLNDSRRADRVEASRMARESAARLKQSYMNREMTAEQYKAALLSSGVDRDEFLPEIGGGRPEEVDEASPHDRPDSMRPLDPVDVDLEQPVSLGLDDEEGTGDGGVVDDDAQDVGVTRDDVVPNPLEGAMDAGAGQSEDPGFVPDVVAVTEDNIRQELTEEDIKYLALKWGMSYRPSEWVKMEDIYRQYASEYEMSVDREQVLKNICKVLLKMEQALDVGDVRAYKDLSGAFDTLRKSAKFTEAQNKDEETRDIDSIGELVAFVEQNSGVIPQFDDPIEYPKDKVDFVIADMKHYVDKLVRDDLGLSDTIETYINKVEKSKSDGVQDIIGAGFDDAPDDDGEEDEPRSFQQLLEQEIEQEAFRLSDGDV